MSDDFPWPLGPKLHNARVRLGLATREAARRASMSDTMWRNLERGYETRKGVRFGIAPRANTVAAAAKVVGLDIEEALKLVGLSLRDLEPEPDEPDLTHISDDRLLEEVRRRLARRVNPAACFQDDNDEWVTGPRMRGGPQGGGVRGVKG